MIKEYIKDNKKYFAVKNHYIGICPYTGKEKRINKQGFKSNREAINYISHAIVEWEQSQGILNNKIKLKELFDLFMEEHRNNVKGATITKLNSEFKRLEKIENLEIKKLTLPFLQKFINENSKYYKKGTLRNTKQLLNILFKYAIKNDLLEKNIASYLTLPRYEEAEQHKNYYTKTELLEFLGIIKNNYDLKTLVFFRLLAYTGIRKGEAMALNWQDIGFKNCTVRINKTKSKDYNGKKTITSTKTTSSSRVISLDTDTIKLLRKLKLNSNSIMIFSNTDFNYILKKIYLKYPKLKQITLHGFRHTHASLLFEANVNIKDVQDRLGHSDIKTTLNIYTHVTEKRKEETANKFAVFMDR